MQTTISRRWQWSFEESWRQFVHAVTDRVGWPENRYVLNQQHRFIYMPIAKVACTSLKLWMLSVAGDQPAKPFNEHREVRRHSLATVGNVAASKLLRDRDYFTFGFVRNPWSRVVSAYLNKFHSVNCTSAPVLKRIRGSRWPWSEQLQTDVSFSEFIEFLVRRDPHKFDEHWRPQHLFLKNHRLNFLGRFETLHQDFALVQQRLGIATQLPHRNHTQYSHDTDDTEILADLSPEQLRRRGGYPGYQRFYTPRLRDLVAQIYAEDIERFGYEFDS
jgi:hypothetical protein